jgi:hypothetical protein
MSYISHKFYKFCFIAQQLDVLIYLCAFMMSSQICCHKALFVSDGCGMEQSIAQKTTVQEDLGSTHSNGKTLSENGFSQKTTFPYFQ